MNNKRKIEEKEEQIRRKIRRLKNKLNMTCRRRVIVYSSSSEDESPRSSVSHATERDERTAMLFSPPPAPPLPEHQPAPRAQPEPAEEPMPGPSRERSQELAADENDEEVELNDEILNLLGEAPKTKPSLGKNIHKQIASRWQELLCKGLSKDNKDAIYKDYLIPANCDLLVAPALNPEAKAALTDFIIKRDYTLQQKQQQVGTAIAALSQAMEQLISKETPERVLKPLSDACRLLCDFHYLDTKTRRNFVISAVKPELKDMLVNTTRGQLLFGDDLGDQIRSAKNILKSGEGLKVTPKHPVFQKNKFIKNNSHNNVQKNNLNFKNQYRKSVPGRFETDRPQPARRSTRSRPAPAHQNQERARERSPPRRTCRK